MNHEAHACCNDHRARLCFGHPRPWGTFGWQGYALARWGLLLAMIASCHDSSVQPFERFSPEVDRAITDLNAAQPATALPRLTQYLHANHCSDGLWTASRSMEAPDATFDLGLAFFSLAEQTGAKLQDPPPVKPEDSAAPGGQPSEAPASPRQNHLACTRSLLNTLLQHSLSPELQVRTHYLRGNLAYLEQKWDEAIDEYDKALRILPGREGKEVDTVGQDAAWNRALAVQNREAERQRKEKENQDKPKDKDPSNSNQDKQDDKKNKDNNGQGGSGNQPPKPEPSSSNGQPPTPPPTSSGASDSGRPTPPADSAPQPTPAGSTSAAPSPVGSAPAGMASAAPVRPDDRVLDQFERAPTWQKEEAKARSGGGRKVRGSIDKLRDGGQDFLAPSHPKFPCHECDLPLGPHLARF